jgi:branched-subunit amino acid aminotransferase/4-amino-4-deoxychorismate lyase
LNRCGLGSVAESHVTVEHKLSPEQQDRRILDLARELGLADSEAKKLLVAPDAIEGEFEIVKPDRTPEQAERADRYRATNEREQQAARLAMTPDEREAHKARKREERAAKAKAKYEAAQAEADLALILSPIQPGEFANGEIDAT